MSPLEIKHFLVVFDIHAGAASVTEFGTDYYAAVAAYEAIEESTKDDANLDAVLLSADSRETIERTHSSYFGKVGAFEGFLNDSLKHAALQR